MDMPRLRVAPCSVCMHRVRLLTTIGLTVGVCIQREGHVV